MQNARLAGPALALLALLPLAATSGCGVMDALGIQKPTASITGVKLQDIDLQSLTMLFDVEVDNPYSVPLPLVNVDYGLASAGTSFLSGEADVQGTVPAQGKRTISLPAKVTFQELLGALKGVKLGSVVPYKADLGLSVDAPAAGRLRVPMSKEGELPVPAPPDVSIQEIKWDPATLSSVGGTIKLAVGNPNQFPVDLGKLAYALTLGKTKVADASIAKPLALAANGGKGTLEIPIKLSPTDLGASLLGMITGDGAGYSLAGNAAINTPFGPMNLPVEKVGKTVFSR